MPVSSVTFESQLEGAQEWRNIPAVIKQAFSTLYNQVKAQDDVIKDLEFKQQGYVQQKDFLSAIASKMSVKEHAFKETKREQQIAATATLKDLHSITASHTALHKKLDTLSKSVDSKVSHADMHDFKHTQRHYTAQVHQQLDVKAAALTAASLKLAADLSALQHHQEAAERTSYTALCDVQYAIDKVNAEAASAVDRLRSGMSASTSEMRQSQTVQRSAMQQSVDAVRQEIEELRNSNSSLCSHVDTKADKEYLQQVMEHLRNTKVSVVELQAVKDALNTRASIKEVNAALSQVSRDVDDKASAAELHNLMLFKDGGFIGPCGRWQCTNGKLRRNGAVVWDGCCMPAHPHHFSHDKADIRVVQPGVYQASAAFFGKQRPAFQLFVNGKYEVFGFPGKPEQHFVPCDCPKPYS
ncbi:hypothetical protein WJX82_008813 [Trebouxia sp. C0006]